MLNSQMSRILRLTTTVLKTPNINPTTALRRLSNKSGDDDEWDDAWETSWLPDDTSTKSPFDSNLTLSLTNSQTTLPTSEPHHHHEIPVPEPQEIDPNTQAFVEDMNDNWDHRKGKAPHKDDAKFKMDHHHEIPISEPDEIDPETQAFVEDMNDNWDQRKGKPPQKDDAKSKTEIDLSSPSLYSLQNVKRDYRLKKQRIHAALWVNEIEKMEEAKLGCPGVGDDIDKLFDSASRIFDSPGNNLGNSSDPNSELKNKPDGWETTSKSPDGSIWDVSQREEDILVQEYERRIAFNKFQIASFIKNHIFSRRRPIDGWKYIIEDIGPNARMRKGSVSRMPSVSDDSTQPFKEENPAFSTSRPSNSSYNRR